MNGIGWLLLTAGLLFGAIFFYVLALYLNDRAEDRAAAYEFRHSAPARTFRVALPYLADGSYRRAAPRRTGPLYPLDLPAGAGYQEPVTTAPCPAGDPVKGDSRPAVHVAAPGVPGGRAATLPASRVVSVEAGSRPGAADSGRLTPRPVITSVPGRVIPPTAPRPGTTSLPGTAVSGGRTHTPHPQGNRSPAATTYDQLLAIATAVNDAWLDRLFAGAI